MKSFIVTSKDKVGFGISQEDAETDLIVNKCRLDISEDVTGEYLQRKEALHPWFATPYLLHLCDVGGIMYRDGWFSNTKTGARVQLLFAEKTIYYYMACLFGDELSYSDITVVLRSELDDFFTSVSTEFESICDYPLIKLSDSTTDFVPDITYTTDSGIIIGVTSSEIGVKFMGDELFYVVSYIGTTSYIGLFSYIGYRAGILFDNVSVREIQKGV